MYICVYIYAYICTHTHSFYVKGRKAEISHLLDPQTPDWSQHPGTQSCCPMWMTEIQLLKPLLLPPKVCIAQKGGLQSCTGTCTKALQCVMGVYSSVCWCLPVPHTGQRYLGLCFWICILSWERLPQGSSFLLIQFHKSNRKITVGEIIAIIRLVH